MIVEVDVSDETIERVQKIHLSHRDLSFNEMVQYIFAIGVMNAE